MSRRVELSPELARVLNFVGMVGMLFVALSAYWYQFSKQELPCTLCLLQRVAMLGVAFGAVMNLKFGPKARHYGICLVSAVFGGLISMRQTALHLNPFWDQSTGEPTLDHASNPPFGEPVLGLHLYVWGLIVFTIAVLATGIILMYPGQWRAPATPSPKWLITLTSVGVLIMAVVASAEALTTFAECGPSACPNDGSWDWWLF